MSKAGKSLLRGARAALDYARGAQEGVVRKTLFVEEFTDAELEAISRAEVPVEHKHLNVEFEG